MAVNGPALIAATICPATLLTVAVSVMVMAALIAEEPPIVMLLIVRVWPAGTLIPVTRMSPSEALAATVPVITTPRCLP